MVIEPVEIILYLLQCNFYFRLFWASYEGFKIASCIAPQTWYLHGIQSYSY